MRPISGLSACAARSRIDDALAALLVASPRSGPPGSPNLSSRFSAAPLVVVVRTELVATAEVAVPTEVIATAASIIEIVTAVAFA
jgi:hypothetical protein